MSKAQSRFEKGPLWAYLSLPSLINAFPTGRSASIEREMRFTFAFVTPAFGGFHTMAMVVHLLWLVVNCHPIFNLIA